MKLTILGNNGPYPAKDGATSSYLLNLENGKKIVLDMGSGAFSNLLRACEPALVDAVIISHLHYDHVSDLGVFSYYLQSHKKEKIQLYFPERTSFTQDFEKKDAFEVKYYNQSSVLAFENTKITFQQTNHPVLTYACLVDDGVKKFLYTGDTNYFSEIEELFYACDVALCDSFFLCENADLKRPHMSVKTVCELAQKHDVKVILTHLNPDISKGQIKGEAFGNYIISSLNETYEI